MAFLASRLLPKKEINSEKQTKIGDFSGNRTIFKKVKLPTEVGKCDLYTDQMNLIL